MGDRIHLQIITPTALVCDCACAALRVPLPDGSMGILPSHAPLLGAVEEGIVLYTAEGRTHYVAVARGVVHVADDEVALLVDAAETAADAALAGEALERVKAAARSREI